MNSAIEKIYAREILDSRGNPTIEVDVLTRSGHIGRAAVPSGASTGEYEAIELRDMDNDRYFGKGVRKAVNNINTLIAEALVGFDAKKQTEIDHMMISLDGTDNKSNLGANAILGVSMAVAHANAKVSKKSLYEIFSKNNEFLLPMPMMNILNGGSHANNSVDIQEFMIVPFGANTFSEALQMGTEVFHHLKSVLNVKKMTTAVGDEGGFAPNLNSNEEAIEIILESILKAGLKTGTDIFIALDVAASELYENGLYNLISEEKKLETDGMVNYLSTLVKNYPIISIEDGLHEDDWDGWNKLTSEIGANVQIVGDDLTVTNMNRLQRSIDEKSMNAILIKLNQIGTVTETIQAIDLARDAGFGAIISHRSGETEDTTIADLAVGMGMGQIKTGSASRTDRICKYNQLLRIEEELGVDAKLANRSVLGHIK
ncbi:MAG: phosphopyruvate hydratase [Candidatus Marinimicrobia bacterium]|nr:phosphopyruvate hydratase [Candidatus Neomarinimicrobiota bacterium]